MLAQHFRLTTFHRAWRHPKTIDLIEFPAYHAPVLVG